MSDSIKTPQPYGFFGLLWRLTLAGAIVLAASVVGGYHVAQHLIQTPESQAPDLLTLTVEEAVKSASEKGFSVMLEKHEPSDLLEPGRVLSQRPAPEIWVKDGSSIRLTITEAPSATGQASSSAGTLSPAG